MGQGGSRPKSEGRVIRPSPPRLFVSVAFAVLLLPLLLALDSCGLPGAIPSLLPPVVPTGADASGNNVFAFENQPQVDPGDFYGFEIYYKFYDSTPGNPNGSASIQYQNDSTQLSSTVTGPSQLISLGYRRAYVYPSGYQQGAAITLPTTPLIPVTDPSLKTSTFPVTISFATAVSGGSTNTYPEVLVNGQPIGVLMGRYLGNPPGSGITTGTNILEGFGSQDFALDQGPNNGASPVGDLPASIITEASGGQNVSMILGLYAIAYGLVNFTTPVYSTPTPLDYVAYNHLPLTLPPHSDP